jgi:hypothetical protein
MRWTPSRLSFLLRRVLCQLSNRRPSGCRSLLPPKCSRQTLLITLYGVAFRFGRPIMLLAKLSSWPRSGGFPSIPSSLQIWLRCTLRLLRTSSRFGPSRSPSSAAVPLAARAEPLCWPRLPLCGNSYPQGDVGVCLALALRGLCGVFSGVRPGTRPLW